MKKPDDCLTPFSYAFLLWMGERVLFVRTVLLLGRFLFSGSIKSLTFSLIDLSFLGIVPGDAIAHHISSSCIYLSAITKLIRNGDTSASLAI